jgi:hypothetical protein
MGRRTRRLPWYLGVLMLAGCEVFEQTNTGRGTSTPPGPTTTANDTGPRTSTGTKPPTTAENEPPTTTPAKPRTKTATKPRKTAETKPQPPSPAPSPPGIISQKPMNVVAACLAERWGTAFPNLIVAPVGKGIRVSVSAQEGANLLFEAQVQPSGKGSRIILGDLASNKEPLVDQAVQDAKSCAA